MALQLARRGTVKAAASAAAAAAAAVHYQPLQMLGLQLAVLALAWCLQAALRRLLPAWARRHHWVLVCLLRLAAGMAAAALPPVGILPPAQLPSFPALKIPSYNLGICLNSEAIFLAACALCLPLPLRDHLWVQALALRSLLWRMHRLSSMHTALPQRAPECQHFVLAARLAMQAVVPGAPLHLPLPPLHLSCWMLHLWVLAMVGFALPTAVMVALQRHAKQQQTMSKKEQQAAAAAAAALEADSGLGAAGTSSTPPSPAGKLADLEPGSLAGCSRAATTTMQAGTSPRSPPTCLDQPVSSGGWGAAHPESPRRPLPAPLLLAGHLGHCLLFLLPVGALVWAMLEIWSGAA